MQAVVLVYFMTPVGLIVDLVVALLSFFVP